MLWLICHTRVIVSIPPFSSKWQKMQTKLISSRNSQSKTSKHCAGFRRVETGLEATRLCFSCALALCWAVLPSFSGSWWQGRLWQSQPHPASSAQQKRARSLQGSPETHSDWVSLGHVLTPVDLLLLGALNHDWLSSGLGPTPDSQIMWIPGGEDFLNERRGTGDESVLFPK